MSMKTPETRKRSAPSRVNIRVSRKARTKLAKIAAAEDRSIIAVLDRLLEV